MMFSLKPDKATKKVLLDIGKLDKDIKKGIKSGLQELGANMVRTGENQALNEPKYGREYKRKGRTHRASAPGQSPALDTGNYFKNFDYESHSWKSMEFGNNADYAEFLEFGTKRMEPRPGVENAVIATQRNARVILERKIKDKLLK